MSVVAANDLWAEIRSLGYDVTPAQLAATRGLFAPLAPKLGPDVSVHRDVYYGPDPRHRMDVFVPRAAVAHAPVLVFVHGGGFVGGDKGAPDAPFYSNVGLWAARSGCVGVTMTYRLAPAASWPAGSEDAGAAVRFLRDNLAQWHGDPDSIFLMGQSAGAVHVAGYVAAGDGGIAGAIMISGIYDIARADRNPFQAAYYGEDAARYREQSTIAKLAETSPPCFYTVSEFDPPDFQRQAAWLVEAYATRQGRWPRLMQLTGHNHLSSVLQIGSAVDTLGPELLRFIQTVRG
jgi:acetyl esterase/lipase